MKYIKIIKNVLIAAAVTLCVTGTLGLFDINVALPLAMCLIGVWCIVTGCAGMREDGKKLGFFAIAVGLFIIIAEGVAFFAR